jgi:enoyl-CoA hydratase
MTMQTEWVQQERDGALAVLTLANPPQNALNRHVVAQLDDALHEIEGSDVRAVIITGSGHCFSTGAELGELVEIADEGASLASLIRVHEFLDHLERFPIPVIAAINGDCLGGGLELALACNIRITSDQARLGLPEITLGVIPGAGGTRRLLDVVGRAHAHELILSGRRIRAPEALRIGLVNSVEPQSNLLTRARRFARRIASKRAQAIRAAMECLDAGWYQSRETARATEIRWLTTLARSEEIRRSIAALPLTAQEAPERALAPQRSGTTT